MAHSDVIPVDRKIFLDESVSLRSNKIDLFLKIFFVLCLVVSLFCGGMYLRSYVQEQHDIQTQLKSGDLNLDGTVDALDLSLVLRNLQGSEHVSAPAKIQLAPVAHSEATLPWTVQ